MFASFLPGEVKLDENETIAISSADYLNELETLMMKTSNRTIVNFIFWQIVDRYSTLLGIKRTYINDTMSLSEKCFHFTVQNLPISINAQWVRNYINRRTKPEVIKLVTSIKEEFEKLLKTVKWLDEETRSAALKKIHHMDSIVAYPEEFFSDEMLFKVYENVSIDESKYFETVLQLNKLDIYDQFRNLHAPINKTDWITHSFVAVVNAFYFSTENNIRKFN